MITRRFPAKEAAFCTKRFTEEASTSSFLMWVISLDSVRENRKSTGTTLSHFSKVADLTSR